MSSGTSACWPRRAGCPTRAGRAPTGNRQTATLTKRLRQIHAAENAHAREIETLAHLDNPHAPAVTALRSRVLARFTELEDERTAINTQLAGLAKTDTGPGDPPCSTSCRCWETGSPTPQPASSSSSTEPSTCSGDVDGDLVDVLLVQSLTDSTPRAVAAIINDADGGGHPGHNGQDPSGPPIPNMGL